MVPRGGAERYSALECSPLRVSVSSGDPGTDLVHARARTGEKDPDHLTQEFVSIPRSGACQRSWIEASRIGHLVETGSMSRHSQPVADDGGKALKL